MFRFYIALLIGKFTALGLKIARRRIPYYPGYMALKYDRDFIKKIGKPDIIIGVTGTNGKTTITSILTNIFKNKGYRVLNNDGFNIETGIAAAFLKDANLFGKAKADIAILEIDEKQSIELFKGIVPNYLICTNLSRDSMRDNGNIDYILSRIKKNLPDQTKLILNSDDLIACSLGDERENIYFGLDRLSTDKKKPYNIISDLVYCPSCDSELTYLNVKYNHVGRATCKPCNFANPEPDYLGKLKKQSLLIEEKNARYEMNIIQQSIFNIYNQLSIIALLRELGYTIEEVKKDLSLVSLPDSRFDEEIVGDIRLVSQMAKGQNPVACSTAFDFVRNEPGNKAVILFLDDIMDMRDSVETVAWYYDVDFEFLDDKSVTQIIIEGPRGLDVQARLLIAGIKPSKIILTQDNEDIIKRINLKNLDSIFLLHDILRVDHTKVFKARLSNHIRSILKCK